MNVSVYSRGTIERIIAERKFPDNTVVISFCDTEMKNINKNYSHVDYSMACSDVIYCEVDDLDLADCPKTKKSLEKLCEKWYN